MTLLAIHRSGDTSLATDRLLLAPEEVIACEAAVETLARLQQLLATRQRQLDQALAEARERGWAEGHAQALQEVAPQLVEGWLQAAQRAEIDAQALKQALIVLGRQVVQRIAQSVGPGEFVGALARQAVDGLLPDARVVIRVHPDVAEAAQAHLARHGRPVDGTRLDLRLDTALGPYDCVIDTPQGQLLAGLPAQLDNLARRLGSGGPAFQETRR